MRRNVVALVVTAVLVGGVVGAGVTYAATAPVQQPNANGVITSCYTTAGGKIRLINSGTACVAGEKKLTWSQGVRKPTIHVVGATGEPAFAAGYQAYDGPPFGNLSFFKDASGTVHLAGLACRSTGNGCLTGSLTAGSTPVFTLPPGFRPNAQRVFTTLSYGAPTYYYPRIDVRTDGVVVVIAPPSAGLDWISFDGISFPSA
jgi:hypothetical protein